MKFLTLNCQSFNTAKKDLENLCQLYSLDILCLTETWESENSKNWDQKLDFSIKAKGRG